MSKICYYHGNCFDGMTSAWVVNKRFPDSKLIPYLYGDTKILQNIEQDCYENANINDEYILADISFPRELMIIMSQKAPIIVLDHHKTAQAACEGLDFCIFDMNESGASLAWKYFFPNEPLPNLVKYIKDRDLWLFQEPNSKYINAYIQSWRMDISTYDMLYKVLEDDLGVPEIGGRSIERYKDVMVETMCKNHSMQKIGDYLVPVLNASILFSEVGHELCKQFSGAPFAAYYFDRLTDNTRQWGLRSIGDFDVSEVAKRFGGGGHKNSAGFQQYLSEL